jgi:acyl-CoA thioester hydrolase
MHPKNLSMNEGVTMAETPSVSQSPPGTFVSRQPVFWDSLDLMGIMHNGAYLLLFERARTDFWRSLGVTGYGDAAFDWPYMVARNEIDYRAPITSEQIVKVAVFVTRIGTSSVTFGHEVRRADGALAAEGKSVLVRIDPDSQRPIPWSDAFRALVTPHLRS